MDVTSKCQSVKYYRIGICNKGMRKPNEKHCAKLYFHEKNLDFQRPRVDVIAAESTDRCGRSWFRQSLFFNFNYHKRTLLWGCASDVIMILFANTVTRFLTGVEVIILFKIILIFSWKFERVVVRSFSFPIWLSEKRNVTLYVYHAYNSRLKQGYVFTEQHEPSQGWV